MASQHAQTSVNPYFRQSACVILTRSCRAPVALCASAGLSASTSPRSPKTLPGRPRRVALRCLRFLASECGVGGRGHDSGLVRERGLGLDNPKELVTIVTFENVVHVFLDIQLNILKGGSLFLDIHHQLTSGRLFGHALNRPHILQC